MINMVKYCPKCGKEQLDVAKFCSGCGAELADIDTSKEYNVAINDKTYTIAIVAGYILAILLPLLGLIISIYLLTRKTDRAKRHGKFILIVAIIVWFISFFVMR